MKDVFNTRIEMESMILSVLIDMPDLEARLQPLYAMIEQEAAASREQRPRGLKPPVQCLPCRSGAAVGQRCPV